MKKEILKPVELPLSLEKTYRLVDAEGYARRHDHNRHCARAFKLQEDFLLASIGYGGLGEVHDAIHGGGCAMV